MLPFDREHVIENVRDATTEDLLDRATVYRAGMEAEALELIEAELGRRGVDWQEIKEYDEQASRDVLLDATGVALRCSFCLAPAVEQRWGWHWLWDKIPVFPQRFRYCRRHRSAS
jgi:hypothetical protein